MPDTGLLPGLVMFLFFGIAGALMVLWTRNHRDTMSFQVKLFLVAYVIRFALSLVIYQSSFVSVLGDEDSSGWYGGVILQQRWVMQKAGLTDLPQILAGAFDGQHTGYKYLTGLLFYLTDAPYRLPAAALNCMIGALTVVFTYRIARTIFSEWVGFNVAWWCCFFPSMLVWSAQTVKEPVVILLETIALYACLHLKAAAFTPRHLALSAIAVVLLLPFRFYAAYIAVAAAVFALVLPQFQRRRLTLGSGIALAAIVFALISGSGMFARHEAQFDRFDLNYAQTFRKTVAYGGSAVDTSIDITTPTGLVAGIAVGAAHLMLAPFPWQWGGASARLLLTLPELFVWWYFFFFGVIRGLRVALREHFSQVQPLVFYLIGLVFLYSLTFGNVGLAYRQRAQLLPWLLIFAAVGFENRRQERMLRAQMAQERLAAGASA